MPPKTKRVENTPMQTQEGPTAKDKLGAKLAYLALGIVAACVAVFTYWGLQPTNVLEIKNSPFPTRSVRTNAEPDGVIILTIDYCKNTTKRGEVRTSFVSTTREIFLPIATEQYDKGCRKEEVPVLIPKDLPTDNYRLKFTARYDINPLKEDVPIIFESQEFHVNPAGADDKLVQ